MFLCMLVLLRVFMFTACMQVLVEARGFRTFATGVVDFEVPGVGTEARSSARVTNVPKH